ncbi:MAG: CBS domain-containing protein [Bacilli bacterium]|nr:CBS domain-containing protein [Bacilli bacterium]
MNLEKIMSKDLIVGSIDDTLFDIALLMQQRDIGFVPIAEDDQIIGVITDRDIVINCLGNKDIDCKVKDYITRNIISIDIDENVEDAIKLMGDEKVKRLLVNDNGNLAGIISLSDIITTDIDNQIIIDNLKKLWKIDKNTDHLNPKVNEFKL